LANQFEDLKVWQRARQLTSRIYLLTNQGTWARDYGLRNQIQRAVVSIMANIAEGYERRSDTEFLRFLDFSKASAGEVRSHLYVALDVGYISNQEFDSLKQECIEVIRMIASFMNYIDSNRNNLREDGVEYEP